MATANIAITEGSGKNLATNSITEDAILKQVQRAVLNNSSGTEVGTAANPIFVSLETVLSSLNDSMKAYQAGNSYLPLTASGLIYTGSAVLVGMYVSSTTSGTVKIWDNTAGSTTTMIETVTPGIGWHFLGNGISNTGLYATLTGTISVTFFYYVFA